MALLDSEASFKARCDALAMKADHYDKLKTNGQHLLQVRFLLRLQPRLEIPQ